MPNKTTGQALAQLIQSRKFLVLIMDLAVSVVLYFGAKYASANMDDIKFLIGILQPVVLMVIYAIAKDNQTEAVARSEQARMAAPCPGDENPQQ